jgi:hypothetical protein
MKKSLCTVLLLWFSTGLVLGSPKVSIVTDGEDAKLQYASAQHEIISILLQEQRFDAILPELEKMLALNLKGEHEKLMVQSIWVIVDQLVAAGQFSLSHKVIDSALPTVSGPGNEFTLLMLKGKIYKEQGMLKEAIELYRAAQEIQQ